MSSATRFVLALTGVVLLAPAVLTQTYPPPPPPAAPGIMRDANPYGARDANPYGTRDANPYVMRDANPYGGQPRQMTTYAPPVGSYANEYYPPPPQRAPVVAQTPPPPAYIGGYGANLGMIGAGPGVGYGSALQGLGSYTQAAGQYWNDIEQARMSREQVKQRQIETRRQELQFEMDYEKIRPTTQKMVRKERDAELQWARSDPPLTEIWSGRTFNVLLRSILDQPSPLAGPNIPLEPHVVKGLNLTDQTTRANLSLTKDQGRIDWTETLQGGAFDAARTKFQKGYDKALQTMQSGNPINRTQLQELRNDLDKMNQKLDDMVADIPMGSYIESRRLLNQLKETVTGLGNARVVRSLNPGWRAEVRTVAQLVGHCMRNGLSFGPAVAAEDEPAYTAAYYAIRSYERGLVGNTVTTSP